MIDLLSFIENYVIGFILLISILVFIHEMGHYLFAKMFGIKVEAFSIGFGKEIWGFTDRSGTRWKLCPIPFGGYVKMKGEMLESEESIKDTSEDSFHNKPLIQKFLVVFAGPLFNLVFPIIVLFAIAFFSGIPNLGTKVDNILKNSPVYGILQKGDVIKKVDNVNVTSFFDVQKIVQANPGKKVSIAIERPNNNETTSKIFEVTIGSKEEQGRTLGFLGITASSENIFYNKYSLSQSLGYSFTIYEKVFGLIVEGFGKLFMGQVSSDDIGGPIKIAQLSGDTLKQGISSWLFFMAMLSINLAIINLFPIPALDGGHLLIYIIQGITRRKISLKIQSLLMRVGFLFLISLMVLVLLKDMFSFL
jgi:regulator of sigma E protease